MDRHSFTQKHSRRSLMKSAVIVASSFPLLALAARPAQAKMTVKSVAYQEQSKDGHNCLNCGLFEAPSGCKLVDGVIAPDGWCKIWVQKPS